MIWSTVYVVAMIALFLVMINKAQFAETRKVALIPLAVGLVELLTAGLLTSGAHPVLTLVMTVLRLAIVGCCIGAMRRDAAMAKQKMRRRAQRRRMQIAEVPAPVKAPVCGVSASSRCA